MVFRLWDGSTSLDCTAFGIGPDFKTGHTQENDPHFSLPTGSDHRNRKKSQIPMRKKFGQLAKVDNVFYTGLRHVTSQKWLTTNRLPLNVGKAINMLV